MAHEFTHRRRVEFVETDLAGIMHFSNFFRFMEGTEHAFFRSLGISAHEDDGQGMRGLARVQATCDYKRPLRYQDEVEMHLVVREKTRTTLGYELTFHRLYETGQRVETAAVGSMRVVCVRRAPGEERIHAAPLPEEVNERIEAAPSQSPAS